MIAALVLQGSALVAPLTMRGDPPPPTSVAAVWFVQDDMGAGMAEAQRWYERALHGQGFDEWARVWRVQPAEFVVEALYDTRWLETLPRGLAQRLAQTEIGGVGFDPWPHCVWHRLERDAACRQILVRGKDEAARARADALVRELRVGADFAQLARTQSDDRASALRGGDFAIFERSASDSGLREAAFAAEVGEIVGPIALADGFHLIQRVAVEKLDQRLRDDVWARPRATLIAFGDANARTREQARSLADDLAARIRLGESMSSLASEFDDDTGGRERAGDLGWVRRATTRMPAAFDRLFTEPSGTLIGPIECDSGFVLVRREDPGPRSRIDLRESAFLDLEHAWRGGHPDPGATDTFFREPSLAKLVGLCDFTWRFTDAVILSSNARDFVWACGRLPEVVALPDGSECALRATAVQYAGKLAGSAAPIDEGTRGLRKRMLGTATARLRERLGALGDVALEQLMSDLQMRDPRVVVPVYPFVGLRDEHAIVRSSNGADSCLVAVGELTDAQELHVVLHLATNALDLATRDQNSVLSKLRGRLGERASRWPSRVQALISAEAEAVMLRVFGEDARDARNVHGWGDEDYLQVDSIWRESSTDLGRTYAAVRDAWTRYLAGELTLEQALEAIAAEG